MRIYWYADGHFEKATGASIFAESENSDTIEFKLPMASVDSIVHSTFLLPYPQGSEQYGNYRAESLLMHLEQDTVDGGYVWVATIPGGYLANYGTAYISARVESNDLLVVETTEQVRFEIQPGGEYQATPVLPEQGEQIEAHLATIDAALLSINGDITDLENTKQDKVDNTLETDTKTVVGAINELNTQINETDTGLKDRLDQAESDISDIEIEQETQSTSIEANTNAINGTAQTKGLLERVADLEDTVITGETYIVTKTGSSLPTTAQLDGWVEQYAEREPQGGDYIYFTLEISGDTDKNYKYTYSNVSGWSDAVEIPSLESAGNDTKGIVKGSYNGGTLKLFQVNITNGEFQSINVVDNDGTLRELREYLNTNDTTLQNTKNQATENKGNIETNTNDISTLKGQMTNVLNGATPVGKATKAAQDDNGNVITETYQTKAEGVTKQYVKDYAVPRIFNDVYFVATNGYQLEIPTTPASGIQFSTTTDAVGDFEIFLLQHTNTASYELSSKNSSQNAIFVSASVNAQVYFRMTTQVYIGNQWKNLSIELSDLKEMTAGEIYKIEFSSSFTSLGNEVVTVEDGGLIRQKFEVMTQSSTTTTFDVYSNETYPSRFNLNTQSETLIISEAATKININGIYTPVVNFVSDPQTQINAKQDKTDSNLQTTAQTVVGAINEVNNIAKQTKNLTSKVTPVFGSNSNSILTNKTWVGLTSFYGRYVWTDGYDIYYSDGSEQYVLDIQSSTWVAKEWNGLTSFSGSNVWSDGNNVYYSSGTNQYILDVSTSTWSAKTWSGIASFYGEYVWTDGENIYYNQAGTNRVLNKSTSRWDAKSWNISIQYANNIWTDGKNIYYSTTDSNKKHYKLVNGSWVEVTFVSGGSSLNGAQVWTDGLNVYSANYLIDTANLTVTSIAGLFGISYGMDVWTDGINYYYSNQTTQKVIVNAPATKPALNVGLRTNPNKALLYNRIIKNKQDIISDLSTIRSGASAGATAVQPSDISDVVTHDDTVTTASETTFADNYYTKTQIIDLIYPIGSVFITVNNVNPKTYLPNTNWELLEDRFLLGAGSTYTAGATGGEATHTLTTNEMPSHYHRLLTVNTWSSNAVGLKDTLNSTGGYNTRGIAGVEQTSGDTRYVTRSSSNQNYVENTGGGQAHNNMPPYLVVYMWKRIPLANS